jgi:sugar phosphate isomerase/epimerase
MADDPFAALTRIADMGYVGVEIVSGMVDAGLMKQMLDDCGLAVCAAHSALPDRENAAAVLDEQELLDNECLIVSSSPRDFEDADALARTAERFNEAAALAGARGMRVGYHNHYWEWVPSADGRPAYDVFWEHLVPALVAEVDLYWAEVAGHSPAQVVADLGPRAELVHVKDGPLVVGEPMTAVGSGRADVAAAVGAGDHVRWHIVELDDCADDMFQALAESAEWLVAQGLSARRL